MTKAFVIPEQQRPKIYIALEELDFVWTEKDVLEVDRMWNRGSSIWEIGRAFNRDIDEVAVLIMDRCRHGYIKQRLNGVFESLFKGANNENNHP
ncbi:helix-turn-helix domain-containing protein [Paenibacillus elgii]|uniref:helix-turn-helix domain-containing protein n=1 Tax=Paenibacillus elgii TaxID=189691 RepID=UPI00203E6B99|nr:helix-turn-helix domain-containing protein [Paenibacillus elgii]MCM3273685.1 helix-turn-helix domain-containing protein [Paenibacillus elgii]